MGYPVAYLSGNTTTYETGMFKRGTIGQNQGPALTGNYRWWNGIDVTSSQYLIYSDTYTTSASTAANATPAAWSTPDLSDQSLLNLINTLPERVGKLPFTYLPVALQWIQSTGRYFLLKNGYENIVTNGLALNLDAGWYLSYSGTGTTWKDIISNTNETLTNGPTFSNTNGGSIAFDGVDDYVSLQTTGLLSGWSAFTYNVWIYVNAVSTGYYVGWIGANTSQTYYNITIGQWNNTQKLWIEVDTTTGNYYGGGSGVNTFPLNQWFNVTMTYDGSKVTSYINTVQDTQFSATGDLNTITKLVMGAPEANQSNGYLNGRISIGQIYNRALNLTEITQNFNAQKTRFELTADTIVTSGLTFNLDMGSVVSYPTTGTSWYDVSGNNYNGTLNNSPTYVSSGASSSLTFDGIDDSVSIGDRTSIFKPTNFTISVWFYSDNTNGNGSVIRNRCYGWGMNVQTTNVSTFVYDTTQAIYGANCSFTPNQYNNVVLTFGNNNTSTYLNGVLQSSQSTATNSAYYVDCSNVSYRLALGKDGDYDGAYFKGKIAVATLYNRPLSQSEITQNYNALKSRYGL